MSATRSWNTSWAETSSENVRKLLFDPNPRIAMEVPCRFLFRAPSSVLVATLCVLSLLACATDVEVQRPRPPEDPRPSVAAAAAVVPRLHPSVVASPAVLAQLQTSPSPEELVEQSSTYDRGLLLWRLGMAEDPAGTSPLDPLRTLASMTEHPLHRWAALRLGSQLLDDSPDAALELLAPLALDAHFMGAKRARKLQALATFETDPTAAIPLLRAVVAETHPNIGAASVGMPLASLLIEEGSTESLEEALRLYRRVATRAPRAAVGRSALALTEEVLAALPEEQRTRLTELPLDDQFARAEALTRGMLHREAEQAFEAISVSLRAAAAQEAQTLVAAGSSRRDASESGPIARRCEALLGQGKAMLRRRARRRGAPFMRAVGAECTGDVEAWAHYKSARAFARLSQKAEALREYALLLEHAPRHRLADDAHYRSALLQQDVAEAFRTGMRAVIDDYPEGDMRGEAFFRLGMYAREHGEHQEAASLFEQGVNQGEIAEDVRGRCAYWHARSLVALDRPKAEVVDAYVSLAEEWPLSYYAQQAMAHLAELDPERLAVITAQFHEDEHPPIAFLWRDAFDTPAWASAVALFQVGEHELAAQELEGLGLLGEDASDDDKWVCISLFAEVDDLPRVTRMARSLLDSFRSAPPIGEHRVLWRLAYPRAFSPLIELAAEKRQLPPALVRAIAREESSFDPRAMSWAHAYGLVQVILPTARRHDEGVEGPINAQTLRQPATNLAVGTNFMAWLSDRYDGEVMLIPPAYNAGHGALERWLRRNRDLPFDEFVEAIPFDETRRYTRRVLQTYGIYAWLDEQRLPTFPSSLPR